MARQTWLLILGLAWSLIGIVPISDAGSGPPEAAPLFDPAGYRIADFRAPVPATAPGARTLDTAGVRSLIAVGDALLIDVLPAPQKPPGLSPGTLWLPPPRLNLPGSVWLANVGYGRLSDALAESLTRHLEHLTGGDRSRPLIIYCDADCWMSWNAARRIASLGYTQVYWYPAGTTGWAAAGLPLAPSQPLPTESNK